MVSIFFFFAEDPQWATCFFFSENSTTLLYQNNKFSVRNRILGLQRACSLVKYQFKELFVLIYGRDYERGEFQEKQWQKEGKGTCAWTVRGRKGKLPRQSGSRTHRSETLKTSMRQ
jgi:hypothetical protein